jgi:hypothetical protein
MVYSPQFSCDAFGRSLFHPHFVAMLIMHRFCGKLPYLHECGTCGFVDGDVSVYVKFAHC